MNNKLVSIAALLALLAVVLGAFGAHTLKELLAPNNLNSFETGVRYQFYHAIALLIIGLNTDKLKATKLIASLMIIGILCFSFSIYLLSIQGLIGIKLSFLGPITPLGGLILIVSWTLLLFKNLKKT